jgi:inosose dehydratase
MLRADLRVGNAPCSWGTLEFDEAKGEQIGYVQMLDELAETGYKGTELGDWGFMPTDPVALRGEMQRRGLVMLGAFVPVALKQQSAHGQGAATAIKTAKLLAAVASEPAPFLVLADNNGTDETRTQCAGRIRPDQGLSPEEWQVFAEGADRIAHEVLEETGLRTVFHHHCAGYVETPKEITRFLDLTNPELVGLVFDTGHYVYGGGPADAADGLRRFGDRVWYVHFKDCHPIIAAQARTEQWDYFTALRHGVFCELGQGSVAFPSILEELKGRGYGGFVLVEQDVLPGMGSPLESARRNREYLRSIEHSYV